MIKRTGVIKKNGSDKSEREWLKRTGATGKINKNGNKELIKNGNKS